VSDVASRAATMVERILNGSAPTNVRAAAARGALPLPRTDLVRLFVHLVQDGEESIRRDAQASLDALDRTAVLEVLGDDGCAHEVLTHFAKRFVKDEQVAEAIVFHRELPDQLLALFAAQGNAKVIDLVLTNQEKLLSTPGLLDRLSVNPALRADQRGMILELLGRVSRLAAGQQASDDEPLPMDAEEAARILDVDVGELFEASEIAGGEEFEQAEDPDIRSAYRKIVTLNTAQKAILAMKGGREERMILIRDTNKVVALSVLKNPRLNLNDVEQIATLRNVSQEVLRGVGSNRDWTKSYTVARALVHNPRTPPGVATNFVSRLTNKDLKSLGRDHNVPELIRRMAKRAFTTRTQQTGGIRKKKA